MGTTVSTSSPEPEERNVVERAWHILNQKPLRMGSMLRLSRLMNEAAPNEKLLLLNSGVVQKLLDMIDERSHVIPKFVGPGPNSPTQKPDAVNVGNKSTGATASASASASTTGQSIQQNTKSPSKAGRNNFVTQITNGRRKSNGATLNHRGVGYGFGSTRSQWDIERTIEQQMVREEQLVWLMNSLTAFVYCASPDFNDPDELVLEARERDRSHVTADFVSLIDNCSLVPMLEYHLKNESIFDISEHMEFYQALLELACSLALFSPLIDFLVFPRTIPFLGGQPRSATTAERTTCLNLLPRFRDQLLTYLTSPSVRMGSPDFRLIDFIQRVQKWCALVASAARYAIARQPPPPQSAVGLRRMSSATTALSPSVNTLSSSISSTSSSAGSSSVNAALLTNHRRRNSTSQQHQHAATIEENAASSIPSTVDDDRDGVFVETKTSDDKATVTETDLTNLPSAVPISEATATAATTSTATAIATIFNINETEKAVNYTNALKKFQINTWKFIGDFGKLVIPFTYRKEAKSLNPFSPSVKERTKRIARELASLHNALPMNWSNSVFVAVDEGRCDLMKVLITGPDETPYQNGCFEFDLFFPSSYPFSPLKVTFLTTGNGEVRFNPNLYQDGKVCLSILNTWEGRPEEKWNPYCSLLQVLISIQALIFVKEPYFNEPGFERYMGTDKGRQLSSAYNQQLQHATLHYAVLEQLKHPPEYFRDVIRRHFWHKKEAMIEQAHQWLRQTQADLVANSKEKDKDKKGNSSSLAAAALDSGLGVVSVRSMERTVEALLQELAQLSCPE